MPELKRTIFESGDWEIDLIRRELRNRRTPVPLGGRAFAIVERLVQSAGELVTKDELMTHVWPGLIVEEHVIQVHISAVRKALGDDRNIVQTVSGQGYRLLRQWIRRDNEQPRTRAPAEAELAPTPPKPRISNVPVAVAELVGRDSAIQELQRLLGAYRAVTLTGPGGIGKTALALDVARRTLTASQGDVLIVELAALSDPALVPTAASSILGLRLGIGEISAESVAQAIGDRKLLLILDNCERVIDGAARFTDALIRMCPSTSILSTSREVLRIEGEYVYRVSPLGLPMPEIADPQDILAHSAVQLFMNRTKGSHSSFVPRDEDLRAIAAICRRLDGIPLAIEFAATRATTLGVELVAARLDDRFGLLTGGRRTALPRHQTLRAVLDWSYELLPEAEQCLLHHLAVFPAGFSLEAAAAVMPDESRDVLGVTAAMTSLFEKSLITSDGSGPVGRWRLLDTIRAYASEKLTEHGEAELAARRHATFFLDFIGPDIQDPSLQSNIDEIVRFGKEIDNVRAALDWAFSAGGDAAIGILLTASYVRVWLHLGLLLECRERCEHAQKTITPSIALAPQVKMQLLNGLGMSLFFTIGPIEQAKAALNEALGLADSLNDVGSQLRTLWVLWGLYLNAGECRLGLTTAERFFRVSEHLDNPANLALAHRLMGNALSFAGDQEEARKHFERTLALYVSPFDQPGAMVWGHVVYDLRLATEIVLARVLWLQGYLDQAAALARSSFEKALATNHTSTMCEALRLAVCPIALETGDIAGAEQAIAALTNLSAKVAAPFWNISADCLAGKLLILRGDDEVGCERLRAALKACERSGWTVCYSEYTAGLALGLIRLGRPAEALAAIDQAIERTDRGGENWFLSELYRMKAELLAQDGDDASRSKAEPLLREAMQLALQQDALFWELRSAVTLADMMAKSGRRDEAKQILVPVYDRVSEGFTSLDYRRATALIEAIRR